jgi:hypothetical protein
VKISNPTNIFGKDRKVLNEATFRHPNGDLNLEAARFLFYIYIVSSASMKSPCTVELHAGCLSLSNARGFAPFAWDGFQERHAKF